MKDFWENKAKIASVEILNIQIIEIEKNCLQNIAIIE